MYPRKICFKPKSDLLWPPMTFEFTDKNMANMISIVSKIKNKFYKKIIKFCSHNIKIQRENCQIYQDEIPKMNTKNENLYFQQHFRTLGFCNKMFFYAQGCTHIFQRKKKDFYLKIFYSLYFQCNKKSLYIRNLKYCTFNTIFRQHNIHLVFSTYQHKYKWILCTEKLVLKASFQDF